MWAVEFSPDGRTLATASDDTTVRVWDANARRELATLTGHSDTVARASFSSDGRTLAAISADNTIRLWDMDVSSWLRRLCALVSRNLSQQEWDEFLPERPYQKTCSDQP